MTATTCEPFLSFRSSTAASVMEEVITLPPPISILTIPVTLPFSTAITFPLSRLRALSFISFNLHTLDDIQYRRVEPVRKSVDCLGGVITRWRGIAGHVTGCPGAKRPGYCAAFARRHHPHGSFSDAWILQYSAPHRFRQNCRRDARAREEVF